MAKGDNDLKEYLQADEEISADEEAPNSMAKKNITDEEISEEQEITQQSKRYSKPSKGIRRLHFWSDWSRNKKIYVFGGSALGLLIVSILGMVFVIRPSKTNSYINSSWHDVVASSSNIDRAVKSEVNLEGTRDLTKELYSYNEKLGSTSFEAKSKSSITYKVAETKEYGDLTKDMGDYFSDSATVLAKTDSDISSISEVELSELKVKGSNTKTKVDKFREDNKLEEDLNPALFELDVYITDVKSKKQAIEKEKKDEEQKKKDEEAAAVAKDNADKASVESVGNSYYKAFVSGSETGVRATLSKGYQDEYDFAALTPARRSSLYPKSYRIVTVVKDGDNYKLTASVTYVSVYQDSGGNNVESTYTGNELYRVVYVKDTGSWKLDGRVDS